MEQVAGEQGRPREQAVGQLVLRPRAAARQRPQHRGRDEEADTEERRRVDVGHGVLHDEERGTEQQRGDGERDGAAGLAPRAPPVDGGRGRSGALAGAGHAPGGAGSSAPVGEGPAEELAELGDGHRGVVDQDGREPGALGTGHVPGVVVEEDGTGRRDVAQLLEREEVDAGVGLAHPDAARVDDHVEEVVEGEHLAPRVGRLAHVVGDERGAVAVGPQGEHLGDHVVADVGVGEEAAELIEVER